MEALKSKVEKTAVRMRESFVFIREVRSRTRNGGKWKDLVGSLVVLGMIFEQRIVA